MAGDAGGVRQRCPHLPDADGWTVLGRLSSVTPALLRSRPDTRAALDALLLICAELLTDGWVAATWPQPDRTPEFRAVAKGRQPTSTRADLPRGLVTMIAGDTDSTARDTGDAGDGAAAWTRIPLRADDRTVGTLFVERRNEPCGPDCRYGVVRRALAGQFALALRSCVRPLAVNDSLTERETEVLRLLARGSSNREIARSLFVSESTAKFHVANVMRKLDVTRRAQVAYVTGGPGAFDDAQARDSA